MTKLQEEAIKYPKDFLSDVEALATRFWASDIEWVQGRTFHSIANECLRKDENAEELMCHVVYITLCINKLVITRKLKDKSYVCVCVCVCMCVRGCGCVQYVQCIDIVTCYNQKSICEF